MHVCAVSYPAARKTAWKSWAWALAIAGFVGLRIWSRTGRDRPAPTGPNPLLPYLPYFAVAAVVLYALLLGTNALTFRFDKPVWTGLKLRLYGLSVAWLLCTVAVFVLGLDIYGAAATFAVGACAARHVDATGMDGRRRAHLCKALPLSKPACRSAAIVLASTG